MLDNATADSLFIKHYFDIKHQGSAIVHVLSSHLNSFFFPAIREVSIVQNKM